MALDMRLYNHSILPQAGIGVPADVQDDERSSHDGKVFGMAWLVARSLSGI